MYPNMIRPIPFMKHKPKHPVSQKKNTNEKNETEKKEDEKKEDNAPLNEENNQNQNQNEEENKMQE